MLPCNLCNILKFLDNLFHGRTICLDSLREYGEKFKPLTIYKRGHHGLTETKTPFLKKKAGFLLSRAMFDVLPRNYVNNVLR